MLHSGQHILREKISYSWQHLSPDNIISNMAERDKHVRKK